MLRLFDGNWRHKISGMYDMLWNQGSTQLYTYNGCRNIKCLSLDSGSFTKD